MLMFSQNFVKQNECYTLFEELDQGFLFINNDLGLISRSATNRERPENKTKKEFSHEIYVNICR